MMGFSLHKCRGLALLLLFAFLFAFVALVVCETQPAPPGSDELDLVTPTVVRDPPTSTPPITAPMQVPATTAPTSTAMATSTSTTEPALETGLEFSIGVAPVADGFPAYNRDEWHPRWRDNDRDCQDTRQEVLIAESTVPVTYTTAEECRVAAGEWHREYTGLVFTDPGDLDVDHLVPLANAHRSGGWAWDRERKERFSNLLSYSGHLIAVQNSANRAKASDGPEEWRPEVEAYWCQYATYWVTIKNTWGLTATQAEAEALGEMLETCRPSVRLLVKEGDWIPTPLPIGAPGSTESPRPSPTVTATYASCDDAEAAGLERMRGSNGNRRGFPARAVPSARDGDGDSVVCEQ